MFELKEDQVRTYRIAIIGLMLLSFAALLITIWVMFDFLREQEIVRELIRQLPPSALASAEELAGELRWQFRLSILVVLNLVVTAVAVFLLGRAYRTSQQSLRDFKVLAADVLNSMDQAVITTDPAGVITSMNRRGVELLKLNDRTIGHKLEDACRDLELEKFRRDALPKGPSRIVQDFALPSPTGTRTLRGYCQPLNDQAGEETGAILQLHDVTERVLMEQQVQRMERYSGLGSLAAGLHHEIKNPLAALSLHVQLFEEQVQEQSMSAETRETLDVLKTEVRRITAVLESFRSYASRDYLDRSWTAVETLLERQVRLVRPQADAAGVKISLQVAEQIPDIWIDRNKMEQVILNLLVNGIEAMPDGGQLEITAGEAEGFVSVTVHDSGCGIPLELRQRIFDPYFTTKGTGTGMGLALSEKIVRQHGGSLELVASVAGAESLGSTFEILLPVTKHGN